MGTTRQPPSRAKAVPAQGDRKAEAEQDTAARERARMADERERVADQRERAADERERAADARERAADEREAALDSRQRQLDERERKLAERALRSGGVVEDAERSALASVEPSRELLARSEERLRRQQAGTRRVTEDRERQQAELSRAHAHAIRERTPVPPNVRAAIDRAVALRSQVEAVIESFAATEEHIARTHEQLAFSSADHREDYLRTAEQAREAARKARGIVRAFKGLHPPRAIWRQTGATTGEVDGMGG